MYERGEQGSADQRAFGAINEVLPYAPFLLGQAHRLFSRLMPGPGKVRWSHEIFPSPRTTRFNEMEYALPYAKGADALREIVQTIRARRINTGFPIEFRSVAADDVWMSPFYGRESATIAVHQYHRVDTTRLFGACEAIFRSYQGRPHWASVIRATRMNWAFSTRNSRSSARSGASWIRGASSSTPICALCSNRGPAQGA